MKRKKGSVGAYFTVEASLVLPIVIGTIIFVLCFLLFYYNRCLMEQDVAILTIRAAASGEKTAEELKTQIFSTQKTYIAEKYYARDKGEINLSLTHDKLELKRTGQLLLGDRIWKAKVSSSARQIHPATFLRLCRKVSLSEGN